MTLSEQVMAKLPGKLTAFLDTLTGNELNELQKIDGQLVAKIYQAGAVFSLEAFSEIAKDKL